MSIFDPKLEKMEVYEQSYIVDLLYSIGAASEKYQDLLKQKRDIEREAAIYREALFGLGDSLASRLLRRVPLQGHLVEARNGEKFVVKKVSLGSDRLHIRADVAEKIVVSGPNLTSRGTLSKGGWVGTEYLAHVKDLGLFVEKGKPPNVTA